MSGLTAVVGSLRKNLENHLLGSDSDMRGLSPQSAWALGYEKALDDISAHIEAPQPPHVQLTLF